MIGKEQEEREKVELQKVIEVRSYRPSRPSYYSVQVNFDIPRPKISDRCPTCGDAITVRVRSDNRWEFYGCSSFPKCRWTRNHKHVVDSGSGWDEDRLEEYEDIVGSDRY